MDTTEFFSVDESSWPLLLMRQWGTPTNAQYTDYLRTSTAYLQRDERHVVILDMRQLRVLTTEQLHRQAEWNTRHDVLLRERLLGMGYVMSSPLMRLAVNVASHLHRPAFPYVAVSTLERAFEWSLGRLMAEGLHEAAERVRRLHALDERASTA